MRLWRKILLYVGLACLVLGLLAYIARDPLRDALAHTVSVRLSQMLQGSLEIGSLRGSLWNSLILHDIVLRDAQEVIGRVDTLRLRYSPHTLLKGRLHVAVDIVRPQMSLRQQPDGTWNINRVLPVATPAEPPPPEPQTGGGLPFALILDHVNLHDGQVRLDTPSLAGVQRLDNLQLRLAGRMDQQGIQVTLQQLHAHALPADVELQTLQATLQLLSDKLQITDLRLQTQHTSITANGVLPYGPHRADFTLHVQPFDVTEIGHLLRNDALHGQIRSTLTVQGPPEAVQLRGQVDTDAGSIAIDGEVNMVSLPLRYRGALAVKHVDLAALLAHPALQSDLNLQLHVNGSGTSPQDVQATLQFDIEPSHVGDITLRSSHMHLEAQQQRFQVQRFHLDTSVAVMTATGAIDLGGLSDLHYELAADLATLQPLLGVEPVSGTLRLQGQAQGELASLKIDGSLKAQQLRYQDNRVQALELTYTGTDIGAQPRFTAQIQIQQVQAGSLPVEQVAIETTYDGAAQQVQFGVDVVQSSAYGGHTKGTVSLSNTGQHLVVDDLLIRLSDHHWQATEPLRVRLEGQQVSLEQFQVAHAEESLALSGAFDGQQFHDVRLQVGGLDLTFLGRLLALPEAVQGRATLEMQLSGSLATPQLDGTVTLNPGTASAPPFEQVRLALQYAAQQWHSTVHLRQSQRDVLTLDLRVPIDLALTELPLDKRLLDAPIALHVALDRPDLAALQRWQPTLPPLAGTLQGSFDIDGNYTALDVKMALQLQRLGMAGSIEQLSAPVQLTASVLTAPSLAELLRALPQGTLQPQVRNLVLRIPKLQGQLPAADKPAQKFLVQDLVLQAAAQLTPQGLRAQLERVQLQASADGFPPTTVRAAATMTPQQMDLTSLQIRLPQSEVNGNVKLTVANQAIQGRITIPRLQLGDLGVTLPANLPPVVQGAVTLGGSVADPVLDIRLQYAGAELVAALAAQWQTPTPRYKATVQLANVDIARFVPGEKGHLQAQLVLDGSGFDAAARQAQLDLRLDAPDASLAPGLKMRLQAKLRGDTVSLDDLSLRSTPVTLKAEGTLAATAPVNVQYSVTMGDLTALQARLGVPLQAKGKLSGTLRGPLTDLRAQAALRLQSWRYDIWEGGAIKLDVTAENIPKAAQATVKTTISNVHSPSLPSSSLRLEAAYTPQGGTITTAVTSGPYQHTQVDGRFVLNGDQRITLNRLRLQYQALKWENVNPINIVRTAQGRLGINDLRLRNGEQEISIQGGLAANGTVQAEVNITRLQIQSTAQAFAPEANLPSGELTLALQVAGTLQEPQATGTLQLSSLTWQKQTLGDIRSELTSDGKALQIDLRWQDRQQELLRLDGKIALTSSKALNLSIQSTGLDLQLLQALSSAVTTSAGRLSLDLQVQGTMQQPRLRGELNLKDGILQLKATGERYRDMHGKIEFAGERINISQFHVGSRSGSLTLDGDVDLVDLVLQHINLTVKSEQFTAIYTPGIEGIISTDLQARGSLEELHVTGKVTIPRAKIQISGLPGGGPAAVQPWELTVEGVYGTGEHGKTADGQPLPPRDAAPLPFVVADVTLDMPRNVWVRDSGTAIELSGALRVTKALQRPFILSGTVETLRGFASFFGKRFDIQQGQVTFTGSEEINPFLDVNVTHQASDYEITLHAGGSLKRPDIDLSSEPDIPKADIISLLVLGKTTDRLSNSEQKSFAGQMQGPVGNAVSGVLEKTVGNALGLDTIDIQAGNDSGTGSVSVGRYVTQDIFLSYERETGEETSNTVGVEYSINRRLKLKGTGSDKGESAVDILWRIEY